MRQHGMLSDNSENRKGMMMLVVRTTGETSLGTTKNEVRSRYIFM